jgi:glycosyltransferase 2 family protein
LSRRFVYRAAAAAFVAGALFFLGLTLVRQREELLAFEWQIEPIRLALSGAVLIAGMLVGVGIWGWTLRRFGTGSAFPALARVWFVSSLGRYLPGKIWQIVGIAAPGCRPAGIELW